ncbi:MAG: T9SS type A sorting domain-containing protein [Ignavibacteriae bacterium]|nr:T9SS type A sorting domain-containing protein [Ignavibacteriota bacterium]
MKTIIIILTSIMLFSEQKCFSQFPDFDCHFVADTNVATGSSFRGSFKPNRTDSSGTAAAPSDSYFPVLVVFVQFKDEASDPRSTWPQNLAPTYLKNVIATEKNTTGNWWDWYDPDEEVLSSQWMEISRGVFHVISPVPSPRDTGAFSVVLPYNASHYDSLGYPGGELAINEDIWKSIRSQGITDWRKYDRWKYNSSDGLYYFSEIGQGDGYVDMIYKIHKSRGVGGLVNYAGYNVLSWYSPSTQYLIDTTNNIKISYGNGFQGSGITVSFRGQLAQYIGTVGHEHGHQLFSPYGHSTYSRVSYGFGFDFFYSPFDMVLNKYMTPTNANMNSVNYLKDFSSRISGDGNLLKVPIQGNEYFLLASRNKYSKWDRVMTGDTAQINPYGDNSEYGKGLYIYHVPNGINFPFGDISQQDMECADGFFEWEYAGQSAQQVIHDCFISGPTVWPYYNKKSVLYENDPSTLGNSNGKGDGISLRNYRNNTYDVKWWGVGEQPTSSCDIGTDRLFTNDEDIYTRFDIGGDREDAWKPGYNEVFSPYSSPNTNTWSNQNSGIFIWYYSYSGSGPGDAAYIKIYKAGVGEPISLDSALHLTPPSRPMGLRVLPCDSLPESSGYKLVKIKWNHNREPDMVRIDESDTLKRYKVYRSLASSLSEVPDDALAYSENHYEYIATVDIMTNSLPEFTDTLKSICTTPPTFGQPWIPFPVRYRVQAIDKYDDESVLSDFANTQAWKITNYEGGYEEEGRIALSEDPLIPEEFDLRQNYPNPFNPSTNIRYDLPKDNIVTIKIFDITGREIKTLVNEFKPAGRYLISFNAANLSSGIYYYKIEAGEYSQVKKMILIK